MVDGAVLVMLVGLLITVVVVVVVVIAGYVRRPWGDYDMVVIGGGSAGLSASGLAASLGARTLLVEEDRLGGECTWTGCVPSKALLAAARVVHTARTADAFGLPSTSIAVDLGAVLGRVRELQARIYREADAPDVMARFGVEVARGQARFVGRREIEITDGGSTRRIRFRDAAVCTGSRPEIPDIPGLRDAGFLTNETLFALETLPRRLLFLGGGAVGAELAQAFRRHGSAVTLVERGAEILPHDAPALASVVRAALEEEGVVVKLAATVERVHRSEEGVHAIVAGTEEQLAVDAIVVAVGRRPNVEELGLERAGVTTDARGIVVDARCRTTNRHVYACGDVAGRLPFTHHAEHMAKVAVSNSVLGVPLRLERDVVPWVTFTDPELAHVGASAADPRCRRSYRFPYDKIDRALVERQDRGWIHVHTDRRGRVVGASVVGAGAGELIAELALAVKRRLSLRAVADTIHAYPTLALGVRRAADQWYVQSSSPSLLRAIMKLRGLRGRAPVKASPDTIV